LPFPSLSFLPFPFLFLSLPVLSFHFCSFPYTQTNRSFCFSIQFKDRTILTASNKKASASSPNLKIGILTINIIEYYWKVSNHLVFFLLFSFPFLFLPFPFLSFPSLSFSFP